MKNSIGVILVLLSLISISKNAISQVGDICPLLCDEKQITWHEELDGAGYHNPYMHIYFNRDHPNHKIGCCVKECLDYFWQNFECEGENVYALHLRKIYTHSHAFFAGEIDPQFYCDINGPARLIYLNHLRGMLAFMIWNNTNPLIATAWDFTTLPSTPPWKSDLNPEEFVIRVYQPYCWKLDFDEHACEYEDCDINLSKQMVLEPCAEINCPCCYFDYHFQYYDSGPGYVQITNVVHVTSDLEFNCSNTSCCFSCAGEGADKWQLGIGTKIYNASINEEKCD